MVKAINNNRNQDIDNDDPVRLLSAILEEMDFSNLLQVFSNKTKVRPINMFAVIIYAYSQGKYSTRDIEFLCKDSQRTKFLLNLVNAPNYSTISRFLSKANNIIYELFCQFVEKLLKLSEITTETIYINGTKVEAYANKYSFVWKKSTLKYKESLEENRLFRKDGLELEFLYHEKDKKQYILETQKQKRKSDIIMNSENYQKNQKII